MNEQIAITPVVIRGRAFNTVAVEISLLDERRTIYEQTPNDLCDLYRNMLASRWDTQNPDAKGYVSACRTDTRYMLSGRRYEKVTTPRTHIRIRGRDMPLGSPEVARLAERVGMPSWRDLKAAFDQAMELAKRKAAA
jgi:hypothetical protein